MFQKVYEFDVDFMRKYPVPSITFTKDDTNVNVFNINLVSNGIAINITDCTVELRFRKSDNTVVLGIATIIDAISGKITYKLGTNEISFPAAVLCGIMIYGQNGERASSYPFRFTVVKDMDDQYDAISSTEYPILTSLIAETTEIRNDYLELMNSGGSNHVHLNMDVIQALEDDGTGTGLLYHGNPIQGSGGTVDSIAWLNVTGKPTFATVATSGSYNDLSNRPTIPTPPTQLSQLSEDTTHRLVTDTEKSNWNAKQNTLSGDVTGHYHSADRNWNNIVNKPTIPSTTSQLTNDSGFATTSYVDNRVSQVTGGSGGDMYRSTYDTDLDGIVDRAEVADSVQWTNVQGRPTIPTDTNQLTKTDVYTKLETYNKTEIDAQLNNITSQIGSVGSTVADSTTNGNILINGVETNIYTHPVSHSASIITQDSTHRFVTDTQISTWDAKANSVDVYSRTEVDDLISAIPTGGNVPDNIILFEDWTGGELVEIDGSVPVVNTAPSITSSFNTTSINDSTSLSIPYTVTDAQGGTITATYTRNGVVTTATVGTGSRTWNVGTLAVGNYNLSIQVTDREGLTSNTLSWTITVTATQTAPSNTAPSVASAYATTTALTTDSVSIPYTITDAEGGSFTATYSVDGITTNATVSTGSNTWVVGNLTAGSHTLTIRVADSGGLTSNTLTFNLTISAPSSGGNYVTEGLTMFLDGATGSGSTWEDSTTNNNDVVLHNTTWNNGRLVFNGTSAYGEIADNAMFAGSQQFTLELTTTPNNDGYMLLQGNDTASGALAITENWQGRLIVQMNGMNGATAFYNQVISPNDATGILTNGTQYHVAIVRNNSALTVYINNIQIGQTGMGSTYMVTDIAAPIIIGRQGNTAGGYFNGSFKNIAYYNRALSTSELTQNYNALI